MNEQEIKNIVHEMSVIDGKIKALKEDSSEQHEKDQEATDKFLTEFINLIDKYAKLRRELKAVAVAKSVIEINDKDLSIILNKVMSNKYVFDADKSANLIEHHTKVDFDKLSYEEKDELGSDHISSWICPTEMVESLYKTKYLVVGISIPEDLHRLVDEARKCLAFQQYNAVYSLCRTIIETTMYDVCIKMGKISKPKQDSREFYFEYPPRKIRDWSARGDLRNKIIGLYHDISSLIHGFKTISKDEAIESLQDTIEIVQKLYKYNQAKFVEK